MQSVLNLVSLVAGIGFLLVTFAIGRSTWRFIRGLFIARKTYPPHSTVDDPTAVVTLIHGTFARGAPWTRPGSALSETLRLHFADRVQLRRFDWSGRNSFRARGAAAEELAADIAAVAKTHPGVPHYLIGHSHGGNVALDGAIASGAGEVDGVICLATPVLTTSRRHFSRLVRTIIGFGFWLILVLPWLNLDGSEPSDLELFAGIACAGLAFVWYRLAMRTAEKVTATPAHNRLDPERVAFIRSPFDEASGVIGLANLMSWIVSRLTDGPFAVFQYLERMPSRRARALLALKLLGITFAASASMALVLALEKWWLFQSFPWLLVVLTLVTLLVMLASMTGFVGTLLIPLLRRAQASKWPLLVIWPLFMITMIVGGMLFIPAILLISIAHAAAVGSEMFLCSVFVEVTAEPCPAGNWTVYQLRPPPQNALRHSSVYESANGLAALRLAIDGIVSKDAVPLMADEAVAPVALPKVVR